MEVDLCTALPVVATGAATEVRRRSGHRSAPTGSWRARALWTCMQHTAHSSLLRTVGAHLLQLFFPYIESCDGEALGEVCMACGECEAR